jgi:hypothetical protein
VHVPQSGGLDVVLIERGSAANGAAATPELSPMH